MPIDTSQLKFPKPNRKAGKQKKSSFGRKPKTEKREDVIVFANEVDSMIEFYQTHRGNMVDMENYRFTKKLKEQASQWIRDVMESQKCDDVQDVMSAWQHTVLHAAEKAHSSHKVGSFLNFWWLIKNDINYLEVMDGKYDREFGKSNQRVGNTAWGNPADFAGVEGGPTGVVI